MPNTKRNDVQIGLGTTAAVICGVSAHQLFKQAQSCREGKNKLLIEATNRNQDIKNITYDIGKFQVLHPQTNYDTTKLHSLPIVIADRSLVESQFKNTQTLALAQIQQLKASMFDLGERYFPKGEWQNQTLKLFQNMDGFEDRPISEILEKLSVAENIFSKAHINANKAEQEAFLKAQDILRGINASTQYKMYENQPFQKEMASLIFQSTGSVEQYAKSMNTSTHKFGPLNVVAKKLYQISNLESLQLDTLKAMETLALKAANLKRTAKGLVATALLAAGFAIGNLIYKFNNS